MFTFKEYLSELFKKHSDWKYLDKNKPLVRATFTIGAIEYVVNFAGQNLIDISFETTDKGKMGITGTGNSIEVFSTVINIIENYLKNYSHKGVGFSARKNQPTRVKLYDKLAQRMKKRLTSYTFEREDDGKDISYFFEKD